MATDKFWMLNVHIFARVGYETGGEMAWNANARPVIQARVLPQFTHDAVLTFYRHSVRLVVVATHRIVWAELWYICDVTNVYHRKE